MEKCDLSWLENPPQIFSEHLYDPIINFGNRIHYEVLIMNRLCSFGKYFFGCICKILSRNYYKTEIK